MSPTPPFTKEASSDGIDTHQQDFNQTSKASLDIKIQDTPVITNGHTEEVKSVYFQNEEEKAKRGRPPKSATKQQTVRNGTVKKRGRPPKVKTEDVPSKQTKLTDTMKKTKRTVNRFKGVSKEELMTRFLPDRIKHGLDILIIGINPGLFAAYKGHHYAGPGNHFWKCLFLADLIPVPLTGMEDYKALDYAIGLTNIVERTTPGSSDLSSKEIREGANKLIEKIQFYKPKIAVFNGKGIYEIFTKEVFGQKKKDFTKEFAFGTQPHKIPGTETYIFVMPSSSARCAQFPRAQDKVHFYVKIKQLRDDIKGVKADEAIHEVGYTFDLQKATELAKVQNIKQERFDPEYEVNDASKNGGNFTSYPVFSVADAGTTSAGAGVQGAATPNALDINNNNNAIAESGQAELRNVQNGEHQTSTEPAKKAPAKIMPRNAADENNVTARHAHLVRYLRQDPDEPGTSQARKGPGVIIPATLSPGNPKLQEDISEELRQERVGNWVREQQCLEYDSDPPMGMERMEESAAGGAEGGVPPGAEIDGASQLSAISAGVSGSASESTSGYGSVDASSRRVRLDRVEMWVLEQNHVRRHNPQQQQQIQQSFNVVNASNPNPVPVTSQVQTPLQANPVTTWQQIMTLAPVNVVPIGAQSLAGQIYTNATSRNVQKVSAAHTSHVSLPSDQVPGTSGLVQSVSAGRSSPYGFSRAPRREGGSGSSFGAPIRPPVPLFSSWGGTGEESNSGGSGISSPLVMPHPTTQPSPTQPFIVTNTSNNVPLASSQPTQAFHTILPMAWQSPATGGSLLAQNYNL